MAERLNRGGVPGETHEGTADSSQSMDAAHSPASDCQPHRPTSALRRRLAGGEAQPRQRTTVGSSTLVDRIPEMLPLAGATLVVGLAAGFLELASVFGQIQGLHQVRWSSLMLNRHAAWMIPVAGALLATAWMLALVGPVLGWAAWRGKSQDQSQRQASRLVSFAWNWAGAVLGTLLVFGPLLTIPGLHQVAVVILAAGLGYRIRRWVVRPTSTWRRGSCWAGGWQSFCFRPIRPSR